MRIKKSYSDFKTIAATKGLEIFFGDIRLESYHVLMVDGVLVYECFIPKDGGADQLDFESNYLASIGIASKQDPDWDNILTTKPTLTSELHTYKKNTITVMTVLVNYETSAKKDITSIVKTRF